MLDTGRLLDVCVYTGPVANMLAVRFTSRRVVMVGGAIICVGFLLTVFAPNIVYLYCSYGLLVGMFACFILHTEPTKLFILLVLVLSCTGMCVYVKCSSYWCVV